MIVYYLWAWTTRIIIGDRQTGKTTMLKMLIFILIAFYMFSYNRGFNTKILVRHMQLSSRASRISVNTVNSCREKFKPIGLRYKKTLPKPDPDDSYKTNPYYNNFPQVAIEDNIGVCAWTADKNISCITQHVPGVWGKEHPVALQVQHTCKNPTCEKLFPCMNPYCDILRVSLNKYVTHKGTEPKDEFGKIYTSGIPEITRKSRKYICQDTKDDPEYCVLLDRELQVDPKSLTLTKLSGLNQNPQKGYKILNDLDITENNE